MELKDLVGLKKLSGVDILQADERSSYGETINIMRFILDGIAYEAKEDPEDGYRSACEEITIFDGKLKNTFPEQSVLCGISPKRGCDVLNIHDANNGKIVLSVGTTDADDYYPCCVMDWNPKNLEINKDVE